MAGERSYSSLHWHLRQVRGRAAEYACVDCGGPAEQWSYDHACPNELVGQHHQGGRPLPYSLDLDRYQPRCLSCHHAFDGSGRPFGHRMPTDANGRAYAQRTTVAAAFTHKVCGRCKVLKPVASFSTRGAAAANRPDPFKSKCLECDRAVANARYAKRKAQRAG